MQHGALSEAQELIQSWLQRSENDEEFISSSLYKPAVEYGHETNWSGVGSTNLQSSDYITPFTSDLYSNPHLHSSTTHLSPPPPPPLPPPLTTDWSRGNTHAWTTALPAFNPSSATALRKKSKLNSKAKRWRFSEMSGEGDIGVGGGGERGEEVGTESVSSIMEGLMRTPVVPVTGGGGGEGGRKRERQDPRVVMDMRHKQVRQRRKVRDEAKRRDLQRRQRQKEAWEEAEKLVREGEREEGRRRRREERLLGEQMETIRQQVQAETERKRRDRLVGVSSGRPHPSNEVLGISKREAVMSSAGECVRREERERARRERRETREREKEERERRRRENRIELVKQLEEVELEERKDRSKVLRRALSVWYDLVAGRRAKYRRAEAWWAWHLMERVWGGWRGYVREKRERREQDRVAREIQREKRLISMAVSHYHYRLLRRCMSGWLLEVGRERGRREREREEASHRDKVQAFLTAAAATAVRDGRGGEERVEEKKEEGEGKGNIENGAVGENQIKCEKKKKRRREESQPVIWQTARRHVDKLLSSVAPPTANEGEESPQRDHTHQTKTTRHKMSDNGGSGRDGERGREEEGRREEERGREEEGKRDGKERRKREAKDDKPITLPPPPVWPSRLKSRPVTKPIPMSGMEARSEEIAERKRRREEREREKEREREERERREEEERREREQKEKEAAAAKRREEKRIAKQREEERKESQRREREQLALSVTHYTRALLRTRGLGPWMKFMERMRRERRRASQFHSQWRLRCCLCKWRKVVRRREREREQSADELHVRMLKRRAWHHWREYMSECSRLEALGEVMSGELLKRVVFRGWVRVTATARRLDWERERRAKIHHNRQLKKRVLRRWRDYVPLVREEREREVRRAGLRRKVSQWLPDYQPLDYNH